MLTGGRKLGEDAGSIDEKPWLTTVHDVEHGRRLAGFWVCMRHR